MTASSACVVNGASMSAGVHSANRTAAKRQLVVSIAVNHADGTLFVGGMLCPIAAGLAAIFARAGWFTIVFAAAGVPVGFAVAYVGTKLTYSITRFGLRFAEPMKPWAQQVVFAPFAVVYFVLPVAIAQAGLFGTWFGTIWLAGHIL